MSEKVNTIKPKEKPKKKYPYIRKTLTVGHNADGSPKRIEVRGKTKGEVTAKYDELKRLHAKGLAAGDMTVYDWSKRWLKIYKGDASETQKQHYKAKLKNNILDVIGHMPMRAVRELHLIDLLNKYKGGKKGTVDKIRQVIQQLFADASYDRVIEYNPAARLKTPEVTEQSRRPLTMDERKIVLDVAKTHIRGPYVLTMLYCGLRRGECLALKREDADLVKKRLSVTKAYTYELTHMGLLTGTKAANMRKKNVVSDDEFGARVVPIPDLLLPVMRELCEGKKPDDLLFPGRDGKQATKGVLPCWWKSFARQCHIMAGATVRRNAIEFETSPFDKKITPHYMRHTYGTDLRSAGLDESDRDEFMGHAPKGVGSTYAAMSETTFNRAARRLNAFHKKQKYFD